MKRTRSARIWFRLAAILGLGLLAGRAWAADPPPGVPLTADECVRIALQNSDKLAQAGGQEMSARGNYWSSYRTLLPSISAGADWSRQYQPYLPPERDVQFSGGVGFDLSQTIFDLPGLASLSAQGQSLRAASADVAATKSDVAVTVRQQFYVCMAVMRLAEVEAHAAQLARDQLHRSETLFELGSVARSDVLQAQVNLADAEQLATQRRNAVPLELGRLALSMGLDPRTSVVVDTSVVLPAEDPTGPLDAYVRTAYGRRPDLVAARHRLRAAELNLLRAKAERLPTVSGRAGWTRSAYDFDKPLLNGPEATYRNSWSMGVSASVSLFSGLLIEGGIQSAKGGRLSQEQSLELQEKTAALEVQEAYLGIFNAREVLRAAVTGVNLAQENLRLQQALYESGAGTLLEWDNARLDLRRAQVSQIQAELDLLSAQAGFRRAVGE
jgi:outer membrane protein